MRTALVLGAGMVGVSTALQLQKRGWQVVIVDRKGPGEETSYGNAGIIQTEAVLPYCMPRDLISLAQIATGRTNDVHFLWRFLNRHVGALAAYWWQSGEPRYGRAVAAWAPLIRRASDDHAELIAEAGAEALITKGGYRLFWRCAAERDKSLKEAETARSRWGASFAELTSGELLAAEPALKFAGIGGMQWLDPWCVNDPGGLVAAYADLFVRNGGRLIRGDAASLRPTARSWLVTTDDGVIEAETAVVALGPWSAKLLRRFNYAFTMLAKRGYHRHYRSAAKLNQPLRDVANGYLLLPMVKGIRITSGAELTGEDAAATPVQLAHAEVVARELIDLGDGIESEPWFGTRPCMPDMLPVIGPARGQTGLWLHFGHGHQGFTLGPTTGRLIAEMMSGEAPFVDPAPYSPDRFRLS